MAKQRHPKITPEERAEHEKWQRLARERIAWREAKQREPDAAGRARGQK